MKGGQKIKREDERLKEGNSKQSCVVFEVFILFLIKLSFSDTTVIEGGRERKRRWDLSLLFWETQYSY